MRTLTIVVPVPRIDEHAFITGWLVGYLWIGRGVNPFASDKRAAAWLRGWASGRIELYEYRRRGRPGQEATGGELRALPRLRELAEWPASVGAVDPEPRKA